MAEYLVPVVGVLAAIAGSILGACFGAGVARLLVGVEDRFRSRRRGRRGAEHA